MSDATIAARLRQVKEQNRWTAQEMADKTGISRRTLESYMRRNGAALPGTEALKQLAEGLGLSLDWLVLGDDRALLSAMLTARLTAERAALPILQELIANGVHGQLAHTLADRVGAAAAGHAQTLFEGGATRDLIAHLLSLSKKEHEVAIEELLGQMRHQLEELAALKGENAAWSDRVYKLTRELRTIETLNAKASG